MFSLVSRKILAMGNIALYSVPILKFPHFPLAKKNSFRGNYSWKYGMNYWTILLPSAFLTYFWSFLSVKSSWLRLIIINTYYIQGLDSSLLQTHICCFHLLMDNFLNGRKCFALCWRKTSYTFHFSGIVFDKMVLFWIPICQLLYPLT